MPKFRYIGDEVRTYGALSLDAVPGTVHDLDEAPDFRWVPDDGEADAPTPDPAAPEE